MDLYAELRSVVGSLGAAGIPYALCGGLAVGVHGPVRATEDIDLLVLLRDLDAASASLAKIGYVHPSGDLGFRMRDGTRRRIHRLTKVDESDHVTVDLIPVEDPVLSDAWETRENLELEDFQLSVLSRAGLVAMKRDSTLAVDRADVERLDRGG